MSEAPLNGGLSDLAKPSQWVPLLGMVMAVIAGVIAFNARVATDEQNQLDFRSQIVQTIADMKSNQLPKRVQTLEDQFAANQQAQQTQALATQAAIQALQASIQTSNNAEASALHDITTQLSTQSQQIASISAQIQYYASQPETRRK